MAAKSSRCRAGNHARTVLMSFGAVERGCYGTARDVLPSPSARTGKRYIDHRCLCECHARQETVHDRLHP